MIALWVVGILALVAAAVVGLGVLRAGRELQQAGADGAGDAPAAPANSVAAVVDASLQRTRVAVEELVEPGADAGDRRPSPAAVRDRAHTYTVVGASLVGMAVVILLGLLLLL